jgi:hypothetical protein
MEHIPKIMIRLVAPENQRYPTPGDWLYDAESHTLEIRVSRMKDYRSEMAVAIHELYEAVECLALDISECDVTVFDLQFEAERAVGQHGPDDEPGDDKRAPYRAQHIAATWIEREVVTRSGLDWVQHEKICNDSTELQN